MIIIVLGVAGSGKSTIAKALADANHWQYIDADDFHSDTNKTKISQGEALTDEDRSPWLQTLRTLIRHWLDTDRTTVLACSALKHRYRIALGDNDPAVRFVYLKGSYDLIAKRLQERKAHFAKVDLLKSQFEILEEPSSDEAIQIDIDIETDVDSIVREIDRKISIHASH
ncbi:gluconokinase [Chamaesiphon polymorphus]|uniref:Gluconokinase n=1 Tax=Chamaesiphon polymorphus CCALA 037 TaxID=2107692 RepID=A0A2T1GM62_9CYAN|nr:gluconokinase [Chamaesiphon polymorphus]PSB58918.1 gluconokinase [Chamaesiphon polymorphus CCALA 037]